MPLPILPNDAFSRVVRTPVKAQAGTQSPFTLQKQIQDWGGEGWLYRIDFWSQTGDDGRAIAAFLTALGGISGKFILKDPGEFNSASLGTPMVNGASQTGNSLISDGWTPSITIFKAGQFIQLGADDTSRLHMVTADTVSDGSGNATLPIWPALRESPLDDDPIVTDEPGVVLRLEQIPPHRIDPNAAYTFSVEAFEAI